MAEKAENIIELKHITKVYSDNGFKAVDDFNLEVKRGDRLTRYFSGMPCFRI